MDVMRTAHLCRFLILLFTLNQVTNRLPIDQIGETLQQRPNQEAVAQDVEELVFAFSHPDLLAKHVTAVCIGAVAWMVLRIWSINTPTGTMLSVLRKARLKDKEMRILML